MTGRDLLLSLADGRPLPGRHLLVTAHPDDETISAAAVLCAAGDLRILQLTTGADNEAVAARRRAERDSACQAAGWACPVIEGGITGREAHRHAQALLGLLSGVAADVDVVWTHPYEGGHLDHDTAAWLVQQACSAQVRMEFASYHATADAQVFGEFWPEPSSPAVRVPLTGDIWQRKQAAIAAYASQASILRKFRRPSREAYRVAPRYDFSMPSAPARCRWDVKGYTPTTAEWRRVINQAHEVTA